MPQLRRGAFLGGQLPTQMARQRPVEMRPADLEAGLEVGEREARVLEIEHRLAERLAVLDELDGAIERALRGCLRADRDREALLRQLAHQVDEAFALLAEAVGHRHANVVEEQFGRVGAVHADLVEVAALAIAVARRFDEDDRNTLPAGRGIGVGLGADERQVGVLAVGDIGLLPVDDIMIAVLFSAGADRLQVRADARFGHRDRGDDFARNHLGQPFALLLFGAVGDQVIDDDVRMERKAERRARAVGELFVDDRVIAEIEAETAIFLRHRRAQHTQLARLEPQFARDDLVLFPLVGVRLHLFREELADGRAERFVVVAIGGAVQAIERHRRAPEKA